MGRVGIYIGNQEVSERYVGNKLVWKKKSTLETIALENVEARLSGNYIGFSGLSNLYPHLQKFRGKYVLKISINDGPPIDIERKSQKLEVLKYTMYINKLSTTLQQYFLNNGVTYEYKTMNITFYLKESNDE